jgi:hypothetical protein
MQSGYSELMGLYPPGESGAPAMTQGEYSSLRSGKAMPPFGVKNETQINDELGYSALPSNFTALPLTTFKNPDIWDDCGFSGCKWAVETNTARKDDPLIYSNYTDISDAAKPGTQAYLNLTSAEIDPANFI